MGGGGGREREREKVTRVHTCMPRMHTCACGHGDSMGPVRITPWYPKSMDAILACHPALRSTK